MTEILDWRPQAEAYVGVYDTLTGHDHLGPAVPETIGNPVCDGQGRRYVDLEDDPAFDRYLVSRDLAPLPAVETIRPVEATTHVGMLARAEGAY